MTPVFEITCTVRDTAPEWADLRVALVGGRLKRHAAVTITILDEAGQDHWTHGLPNGVTQEEAEAFVWGPTAALLTASALTSRWQPLPHLPLVRALLVHLELDDGGNGTQPLERP
jgi:hypothetical protein